MTSFQVGDDPSCTGCGCSGPTITVPCCPTRKFPSRLLVATGGGVIGSLGATIPPMSDMVVPYAASAGPPTQRVLWSQEPTGTLVHTGVFLEGFEILLILQVSSCAYFGDGVTLDPRWGLFASAYWTKPPPLSRQLLIDASGFAPVIPTCVPLFGSYHVPTFAEDPHTGDMPNSDWWFYE